MERLHLLDFYMSTPLSTVFFFTSWFVPHSGMTTVHASHSSSTGLSLWLLSFYALIFLPATLMLFFAPPTSTVFLLSRILPLACVGKLDLPAVSRGPSPLPEPAPAGDIVTGELSCFTFTASLFPFLFFNEGCSQSSFSILLVSACTCRPDLYFQTVHASRMWIHS